MPREEIAFTARLKICSQSQIFRYGQSIFCLPHQPKITDFFELCLHWVSVVRDNMISVVIIYLLEIVFFFPKITFHQSIMCEITSSSFQPKVKRFWDWCCRKQVKIISTGNFRKKQEASWVSWFKRFLIYPFWLFNQNW